MVFADALAPLGIMEGDLIGAAKMAIILPMVVQVSPDDMNSRLMIFGASLACSVVGRMVADMLMQRSASV